MNKKQLIALVNAMVASVLATANKDIPDSEPPITADQARVLLGMRLKRSAKTLVAAACGVEATEVVWVEPTVETVEAETEAA